MIVGVVRSYEAFRTGEALRLVASDSGVSVSETLAAFTDRVLIVLNERWPDCSDGFVGWVTRRAWAVHMVRRVRLSVSPSTLALILRLAEKEPGELASALVDEAKAAWRRLGHDAPPPGIG